MARLPLAGRSDFPDELKYVWDHIVEDGVVPNIFRTMGNNPLLLRGYLRLGNALWANCGLDVKTRELVILRTAILRHSQYEWHQHVRIGRRAGLDGQRINALHNWRASHLFSDAERALFAYADAVAASDHPAQEVHDELARHFPAATIVGVNLLCTYYALTASFVGALEVETESPFSGWQV